MANEHSSGSSEGRHDPVVYWVMANPLKTKETLVDRATKAKIETIAWDCTVGAGNDSEKHNLKRLEERLGRVPTQEEQNVFKNAWARCLQGMAQP